MDFYGNEFAEKTPTPPTPKRKVAVVRQTLSPEGNQVADPNEHLCNGHELLGANGDFVLPAAFDLDGNFDISGLHYPFLAPNQETDIPSHGGMCPPLHQNSFDTLPLGCNCVSARNPGPQGPLFVGPGVSPNYHLPASLRSTTSPLLAASSPSAATTPEPATPLGPGGFQTAQVHEADMEPVLRGTLSAMKLEPYAPHTEQIKLPKLPEGVTNHFIPADSGPSSASAGVDRRRSSSKKASRAPKRPKPYIPRPRIPCTVADCRVTFQDDRARNRHIRSIHKGTRYFCPGLCKATGFSREDALTRHLRNLDDESECKKTARMLGWDPRCKGSVNNLLFLSPGFDA